MVFCSPFSPLWSIVCNNMILRNGNAKWKSKCIGSFVQYCQVSLQKAFMNLDSYQQYMRVPVSLQPQQQNALSLFFYFCQFVCNIVLICMSLIMRMFEHFFVLRAYIFVRNCLFLLFSHFSIGKKPTFKRPIFTTREALKLN